MNNSTALMMTDNFEAKKNTQASMLTLGISGLLLLLFFLVKFTYPKIEPPVFMDVMEVNLGTDDTGSGTDQPLLPGDPAPAQQTAYTPPAPTQSTDEGAKAVETDESDAAAPAVKNPVVAKPDATKINTDNKTVKTKPNPSPVVTNTPPKPKAVLGRTTGSNGNGGNGADTYKPGSGEGVAGGNGDQGRPGGSPNGTTYTGSPRNLGVRVVSIPAQSFEDEFNENGKIALDVVVDGNGRLTSASYQPSGSTTNNRQMIDIAKRRAAQVTYPKYEGGFKQKIIFDFKVKG